MSLNALDVAVYSSEYADWIGIWAYPKWNSGNVYVEKNVSDYDHDPGQYRDKLSLTLDHRGCVVDDGTRNCTAACADPRLVWNVPNSTWTLANCMIAPIIASAMSATGRGIVRTFKDFTQNPAAIYVQETTTSPELFGITPNDELDLSTPAPWAVINDCMIAYCLATNPGSTNCTSVPGVIYDTPRTLGNFTFMPAFMFDTNLCDRIDASLNPDLAGVGMIIAYLIQSSILLAAWTVGSLTTSVTAIVVGTRLLFKWPNKVIARINQRRIRRSRQAAALYSTLVEFQKTQAFFILAVVTACLLAVRNAAYLQVNSWQQLWNNFFFFNNVALSGCYPVVLSLLMIRKTTNLSPYILAVSLCCVTVSTALWINTARNTPRQDHVTFAGSGTYNLPECGGAYPTQSCLNIWSAAGMMQGDLYWSASRRDNPHRHGYGSPVPVGRSSIIAFPLVVQAFLIVEAITVFSSSTLRGRKKDSKVNAFDRLRLALKHTPGPASSERQSKITGYQLRMRATGRTARSWYRSMSKKADIIPPLSSYCDAHPDTMVAKARDNYFRPVYTTLRNTVRGLWPANPALAALEVCYKVGPVLAELALVGMNAMLLARYAEYQGQQKSTVWSLGQIISVTIWIPVGVEFIYLLTFGMEEGFQHRLQEPYHVRRASSDDDTVNASSDEEVPAGDDASSVHTGPSAQGIDDSIEMDNSRTDVRSTGSGATFLTSRRSWEPRVDSA
ncbi:hypothetical protein LTR56_002678 [Elasticomyces elasticus]|nr:hypothetical protein LTR22_014906 [Elasticomyces elasticus]KAK3657162.1 hypothetical protein LTR56_002678 [Elasticomyces elasticus]KAK4914365.1 hypothetical protein LTR49_017396 [Elasticomyces elasticus]KAK5753854.1 hypothetical protein LTS12_016057 [Elasticomyces elasticus]